jgi:alpha-L-fucosidase 2
VPTESVEALWYAEMAKLGSAVRADGPPLGLQGPWSPDGRMPPWGGDLHHNVNVQLSYAPMAVTNHAELTESLVRYIETAMPQWRALARRVFDTDGVFVPSATDDEGRCRYEWALVNLAFSSGPWLAQVIHTHWRHTGDVELLDRLLRPFLHDIAEPLVAQLVADEREALHLPYSYSPELMDASGVAWGPDGSCDLALLGWLLDVLIDLDESAGADTTRWRDLAARLTPLPTDPDTGVLGGVLTGRSGGLRVRRDLALERSHRHHSHLVAIHPLRRLTSSDPNQAVRSIASASLRTMMLSGPGEWVGFSVAWAASIAAHSGAPDIALGYLRDYAERWVGPSTFHLQASHHGEAATIWNELGGFVGNDALSLEAGFAFAAAVTELLVQDHSDVVRIFPALPQSWQSASFAGLRAAGGWELAARADAGHAVVVRVLAHRSGDLTLRYPGPLGVVEVQRTLIEGEELRIIEPGWTIDDLRPLR